MHECFHADMLVELILTFTVSMLFNFLLEERSRKGYFRIDFFGYVGSTVEQAAEAFRRVQQDATASGSCFSAMNRYLTRGTFLFVSLY